MPAKISPFNNVSYGWAYGEDGWNAGMDDNLKKFSFMFDSNLTAIVSSVPSAVSGQSYFNTTNNLVYFCVQTGTWESFAPPKWSEFTIKTTGVKHRFTGTELVEVSGGTDLSGPDGASLVGFTDPASLGTTLQDFVGNVSDATDVSKGAALIGYKNRTVFDRLLDVINVKDEGAVGDGVTDDRAAIQAAIGKARGQGGGKVYFPAGIYRCSDTLNMYPGNSGYHNVFLVGEGVGATVLDFFSGSAGSDGIGVFGWGGRFGIQDMTIRNARANGININKGVTPGSSANWISRFHLRNLVVESCLQNGINIAQAYMGSFEDIEVRNCGLRGFNLQGYHTSLVFTRCWAGGDAAAPNGGNTGSGWFINGLTYGQFIACSSDWNGGAGWQISNVGGCVFTACGSENNSQEGFIVTASTANITGIPAASQGIRGLTFDGCFALNNSKATALLYANFLGVASSNSVNAKISVRGCTDFQEGGTPNSIVLNAGAGTSIEYNELDGFFVGNYVTSGTVIRTNLNKIGKSAIVRITQAGGNHQSLTSGTETTANFSDLLSNTLGATLNGSAGIVIPAGVNRIRITGGAMFGDDPTGTGNRSVRFLKNTSKSPVGFTQSNPRANVGIQTMGISTAIIDVVPGDVINMRVAQSSGGTLTLMDSTATFMSVEAVG